LPKTYNGMWFDVNWLWVHIFTQMGADTVNAKYIIHSNSGWKILSL